MPDLPKKDGRHCRVFKNKVLANNHENFAPKGNIVATVPPGTGVMIMANDEVEVFDNTIEKNQTAGLSIVSYLITDKPIKDDEVRPVLRGDPRSRQPLRGQRREAGRADRRDADQRSWGRRCRTSSTTASSTPRSRSTASCPTTLAIRIRDNGEAGFANFDAPALKASAAPGPARTRSRRRRRSSATSRRTPAKLPALEPVSIEGLK